MRKEKMTRKVLVQMPLDLVEAFRKSDTGWILMQSLEDGKTVVSHSMTESQPPVSSINHNDFGRVSISCQSVSRTRLIARY